MPLVTCPPVIIKFPQDAHLPNQTRTILEDDTKLMAKQLQIAPPRTYKREALTKWTVCHQPLQAVSNSSVGFCYHCLFVFCGAWVLLHKPFPFSLAKVIGTYDLLQGIGYVWIIRVFFVIALFSPLLLKVINALQLTWLALCVFAGLLLAQSLAAVYLIPANTAPGIHYGVMAHVLECSGFLIIALIGGWIIQRLARIGWGIGIFALGCAVLFGARRRQVTAHVIITLTNLLELGFSHD